MKKERLRAVIDIGSHSVRLYIGEVVRRGVVRQVEFLWVPIALGNDIFTRGMVSGATVAELLKAIGGFRAVLDSYEIGMCRGVASGSLRGAANAEIVMERIRLEHGIQCEIVELVTETMVLYSGLLEQMHDRYGFLSKRVLIIEMGAGTTHALYQESGRILFTDTQNEGTLRLGKRYDLPERSFALALEHFSNKYHESLRRLHALTLVERFVAVNDDVFSFLHVFCPEREVRDVIRFSRGEWESFSKELATLEDEEILARLSLTDNLLNTTRIALDVLGRLFLLSGAEEMLLPRISFSSSVVNLLSLSDGDIFSELALELREHAVSSALALAERYRYNVQETAAIRKLALRLFDELRHGFQFTEKERLYLEVAAILHNIGCFVSTKSHHMYSAQLIASAELIGLTGREMRVVAQIARYHRRATPRATHPEYMQLERSDRMVVCRMAALLRLADAIASSSLARIDDLALSIGDGRCAIGIRTKHRKYENLDIIRMSVRKKGDLFESFYGMALAVDRME